jgi:hypothetical protein
MKKKQPFAAICGDIERPENLQGLVRVCDITYTFDNPIDAIETLFKIYFGLNLKYNEAVLPWTFVEHQIYGLNTTTVTAQVATLLNECKQYLEKSKI